jgi:hypothetical protein
MRRTKCPECGKVAVAHYPAKNFMPAISKCVECGYCE